MEIPASLYFSCWSLVSIAFLGLGFKFLDEEKPEASPLVMLILKRFFALSVCHSSSYALIHRPGANVSLLNQLKVSIFGYSYPLYVYFALGPVPLKLIVGYAFLVIACVSLLMSEVDFGLSVDFFVRAIVFSLAVKGDRFFPVFVLVTAFFTAGIVATRDGISSGQEKSAAAETEGVKKYSKKRKFVGIAASVMCSVFCSLLVRFTSFNSVVAFLCFSVAWLGCLALVMPRRDFAIFDFLVSNVLIGCVNRFGISGVHTLFAFVVSVVLFTLQQKLETVRLIHGQDVVLW